MLDAAMLIGEIGRMTETLRSSERETMKDCGKAVLVAVFDAYQAGDEPTRNAVHVALKALVDLLVMEKFLKGDSQVGSEVAALLNAMTSENEPLLRKLGGMERMALNIGIQTIQRMKEDLAA